MRPCQLLWSALYCVQGKGAASFEADRPPESCCWKELAAVRLYPHALCIDMLPWHINAPSESSSDLLS